jgi:hypothetical protein
MLSVAFAFSLVRQATRIAFDRLASLDYFYSVLSVFPGLRLPRRPGFGMSLPDGGQVVSDCCSPIPPEMVEKVCFLGGLASQT